MNRNKNIESTSNYIFKKKKKQRKHVYQDNIKGPSLNSFLKYVYQ